MKTIALFLIFLLNIIFINNVFSQQRICTKYVENTYLDSTFSAIENPQTGNLYRRCWRSYEYETCSNCNQTVSANAPKNKFYPVIEPIIEEVVDSVVKTKTKIWILNDKQKLPKNIAILPPVYSFETTEKLIRPTAIRWVKIPNDGNTHFHNFENCMLFTYEKIPARYDILQRELKPPRKIVGVDTINLNTNELKRFGKMKFITFVYYHEELKRKGKIIINPNDDIKIRVNKIEFDSWSIYYEPNCAPTTAPLQKALKAKGYYKGEIDNNMGSETKKAIIKFQKDNGLPIGTLNIETYKALGM